jgi:hypothetical protein
MIDVHAQHLQVMRRFLEKVHPGVRLTDYNPVSSGMPGADFDWGKLPAFYRRQCDRGK